MSIQMMANVFGIGSSSMWVMVKPDNKPKGIANELFKLKILFVKSFITGIPLTLKDIGITDESLPYFKAYIDSDPNSIKVSNNPIPISEKPNGKHSKTFTSHFDVVSKEPETATHSNSHEDDESQETLPTDIVKSEEKPVVNKNPNEVIEDELSRLFASL